MTFRVFAGMSFEQHGIRFSPSVPSVFRGEKVIENFRYRNANLKIIIAGTGDIIESFTIDGKVQRNAYVRADIQGHHEIKITMSGDLSRGEINVMPQQWAPRTPLVQWVSPSKGTIRNYSDTLAYKVYKNGAYSQDLLTKDYQLDDLSETAVVCVVPRNNDRLTGFSCRPHMYVPHGNERIVQLEYYAQHRGTKFIADKRKGDKFVEVSVTGNRSIKFGVEAPSDGEYFIDVRYANGCGPINTDNKCAIRMLYVNEIRIGALVFPQRGIGEWLSTGFSNMLVANLKKGYNKLEIVYELPYCENMNGAVNTALLDYVRIIKK